MKRVSTRLNVFLLALLILLSSPTLISYSASAVASLLGEFPAKTVFVTSAIFEGNLDGVAGADAKCQTAAEAANLRGIYKAWISDLAVSPSDTFTRHKGAYALVNGTVVAKNYDDLTDGTLLASININEHGTKPAGTQQAWTATLYDGSPQPLIEDCLSWTHRNELGSIGS